MKEITLVLAFAAISTSACGTSYVVVRQTLDNPGKLTASPAFHVLPLTVSAVPVTKPHEWPKYQGVLKACAVSRARWRKSSQPADFDVDAPPAQLGSTG